MFVVVCGLPGTGKTTVAGLVADRLDAPLVRTDVVRREVTPDPEYTPAERRRVYAAAFERAGNRLDGTGDVVLDGTFDATDLRRRALELAETHGSIFRLVKVECAPAVVRERIDDRSGDASDADAAVYEHFRETFEPVGIDHVVVDNSNGLDRTEARVAELF